MSASISDSVFDIHRTAHEVELKPQAPARSLLKSRIRNVTLSMCGVTTRLRNTSGLLLTFDDGPHPEVTPSVLDLLETYHARAVFFVVGNRISRAPRLLKRILDEGHQIGNHTFQHPLDHVPPIRTYYRDIVQCQNLVRSLTGRSPRFFRPPLGALTLGSLLAPRLLGLRTLLWSVDICDWKLRCEEDAVLAGKRLAATAAAGDIVSLHDDNPRVLTVLEIALQKLGERQVKLGDAISHFEAECAHE